METCEEAMAAATTNNSSSSGNSECSHPIVKGKRTKRQKLLHSLAPPAAAAASSTSSSGELSGSTTEEDEDMANCLILLAQGRALGARPKSEPAPFQEDAGEEDGGGERSASRRFAEAATTTNGKASFYVYECKTCNKCFPSFQALGGHRSSHKKPRMALVPAALTDEKRNVDEDTLQISIASNPKVNLPAGNTTAIRAVTPPTMNGGINSSSSGINNNNANKPRVHECSICGSEFSSGQALGGHMRRHRAAVSLEPHLQEAVKKEKSILSLDLNLPAPDVDDDRGDYPKSPSFPFAGAQPLLFSSSALVDCHY